MKFSSRNHEFSYIIILIIFEIFGYATADTLAFIDLGLPMNILRITRLEHVIYFLILIALVASVLTYQFASQ